MTAAPPAGLARLLVLGGAVLWGTTGTAQALAPAAATPATVGAVRLVPGALALLAVALAGPGPAALRGFARPGMRAATATAVGAMAAYQLCFFGGVARAGVAVGTLVGIGSAPVLTGALALLLRRERPEPRWAAATALAVGGVVLLAAPGALAAGAQAPDPLGVLLALGAGAAYALYTITTKVLLDGGRTPAATMAVTFSGAALLLLPLLATGDAGWVREARGVAVVAWLGLGTVGVAYLLFATGLRGLPPATVATLTLAEPLTAATLGVALLGERPGALAVAGMALIAAGLVLLAARRARAPDAPARRARGRGPGAHAGS